MRRIIYILLLIPLSFLACSGNDSQSWVINKIILENYTEYGIEHHGILKAWNDTLWNTTEIEAKHEVELFELRSNKYYKYKASYKEL